MMTPIHKILAASLVVQAGLATATWWPSGGAEITVRPLLQLDEPTSIQITGRTPEGSEPPEPLRLERKDEGWVLPDLHDYPADPDKVDALLSKLRDLSVGAPIATKTASHRSLDVADDAFTRKVELDGDGQPVTVFLGAASGQSAHVRRGDDTQVFAAPSLSAWSIADSARRYYDPVFVSVAPDTVQTLTVQGPQGTVALQKTDDGWTADDLPEGQGVDAAEVDRVARKLLSVRLEEVVGTEPAPDWGLTDGLTVAWTTETGSGSYTVGAEDDGERWLMADDRPHVVKVRAAAVQDAFDLRLDDLLEPLPTDAEDVGDAEGG